MLENYLERTNLQSGKKISVKAAVTVGLICLAVILPQIAHLAVGPSAGMTLLPMYLPALLGGCLLGAKMGPFHGNSLSSRLLCRDIRIRFGHARCRPSALYDGRACGFCPCFGTLFK